jgi:hypothetical protein
VKTCWQPPPEPSAAIWHPESASLSRARQLRFISSAMVLNCAASWRFPASKPRYRSRAPRGAIGKAFGYQTDATVARLSVTKTLRTAAPSRARQLTVQTACFTCAHGPPIPR